MMMKTATLKFSHEKPLKDVCTFGIGGPAQYYIEVRTIEEMQQAFLFCQEHQLEIFILGKGSNCLFDDRGFKGLVIANKIDFFESPQPGTYHVGAGYSFSLLGVQTARQQWAGLEFASGIPCSVGGAIFMNAGANGAETSHSLISVDYLTSTNKLLSLNKEELNFGYRTSSFQQMEGAILGATFKLERLEDARSKQLEIVSYRTKTQPYGEKSAGCVFRNPPSGPAGALIDKAGLKGFSIGEAAVSNLHANFVVNKGKATSQDVKALIDIIKSQVNNTTGIQLDVEIQLIPYEKKKHD
jgi:UDP-N-acetylmuramate dehydrogenase